MRKYGRKNNELRNIQIETNISPYAEGSCIVSFGNTKILCTASLDESIPGFIRGKGQGWVTAEYSMLPRSTHQRIKRESSIGKVSGRTQEIQRLISRSLRSVVDLKFLGERQIIIDCDVLQADGGTRTASITGGYVALSLACKNLLKKKIIKQNPIISHIAAISCGIVKEDILLDLDYEEDSNADVDANFVINREGKIVEVQATAEKSAFTGEQLQKMLNLSQAAIINIIDLQNQVLES